MGACISFFGYGYIFGGLLADKKGTNFIWLFAVVAWSVCYMFLGVAGDIGIAIFGGSELIGFAVFCILFGFFEGPINAA